MDMLRIAVCDDDAAFRAALRPALESAFRRCGVEISVTEAGSVAAMEALLGHMSFDLLFLDIDMPETDGVRFGERLRAQGVQTDIVYVSNMEGRVYDIFRVHPWSFIRKSRYAEELYAVTEEYAASLRKKSGTVLLTAEDGGTLALRPQELLYAEAAGKRQKLFLENAAAPILARVSLRELEELLQPHGFIRIHKGFLVNYRVIRKITSRSVVLDSGEELPVGRDRLGTAREQYLSLMKWKGLSRTT